MRFMTTRKHLLTFEISEDCNSLDIHCNPEGAKTFVFLVERLLKSGGHEHMMTPAWGGKELTEEAQGKLTTIINKVTIHCWK